MRILYFGDFDPNYARNRILIRGLKENGVEVVTCNDRRRGFKKIFSLAACLLRSRGFDMVLVGYSDTRFAVPLAWAFTRKPIIWDAFYSLYDAWVFDRKLVKPNSLKAAYHWLLDWVSCFLADKILLDTQTHIDYFIRTFKIKKRKLIKVLIGADDTVFHPR